MPWHYYYLCHSTHLLFFRPTYTGVGIWPCSGCSWTSIRSNSSFCYPTSSWGWAGHWLSCNGCSWAWSRAWLVVNTLRWTLVCIHDAIHIMGSAESYVAFKSKTLWLYSWVQSPVATYQHEGYSRQRTQTLWLYSWIQSPVQLISTKDIPALTGFSIRNTKTVWLYWWRWPFSLSQPQDTLTVCDRVLLRFVNTQTLLLYYR